MSNPVIRPRQLNLVVRDIDATRRAWVPVLGEPLAQYPVAGPSVYAAEIDGVPVDCSDVIALKWGFGSLDVEALRAGLPLADDVFFLAFWQPGHRDTPWRRHLDAHGEGVMDVEFDVPDTASFAEALGVRPYHVGLLPDVVSALFHTREVLGVDVSGNARR